MCEIWLILAFLNKYWFWGLHFFLHFTYFYYPWKFPRSRVCSITMFLFRIPSSVDKNHIFFASWRTWLQLQVETNFACFSVKIFFNQRADSTSCQQSTCFVLFPSEGKDSPGEEPLGQIFKRSGRPAPTPPRKKCVYGLLTQKRLQINAPTDFIFLRGQTQGSLHLWLVKV